MFLGLRTVIVPAPDLDAAKAWYAEVLGVAPYFDEPFYVGFSVAGYELGLDPDAALATGPVSYWGVPDCDAAFRDLVGAGASPAAPVREVGDGIRVASVLDPAQNTIGIIENPHFSPAAIAPSPAGPGR